MACFSFSVGRVFAHCGKTTEMGRSRDGYTSNFILIVWKCAHYWYKCDGATWQIWSWSCVWHCRCL